MANPFDQFDNVKPTAAEAAQIASNRADPANRTRLTVDISGDAAPEKNPFDQFDGAPAPKMTGTPLVQTSPKSFTTKDRKGRDIAFTVAGDATDEAVRAAAAKATGSNSYLKSEVQRGEIKATDQSKATGFISGVLKPVDWLAQKADEYVPGLHALDQGVASLTGLPTADQAVAENDAVRAKNARTGYQTLGNIAGIAPLAAVPGAASLAGLTATGAAGGAMLSDSDTLKGTLADAGIGAAANLVGGKIIAPVVGAAVKGTAKLATKGAKAAYSKISDLIAPTAETITAAAPAAAPETSNKAASILLKKLADQGQTPAQARQMIEDAHGRGVPLALMDTGDEARGLASGLGRKPGPARTRIRDIVIPRQDAQIDRVQGAITRDLGPTANVRTTSEAMMKAAASAATPIKEKAYQAGAAGMDSPKLRELLSRPSMAKAMAKAVDIAKEEGIKDPTKIGLSFDKDGLLVKSAKPTMQTLDYVKRGLDDVIEAYRDPVTGRLNLDTVGRAVNATQREFIKELDTINPTYGEYRAAFAGPAKLAGALNKGAKVGAKDAETIAIETRDLTKPELEQYRLGARSALSNALEGRADGADKVKAMLGAPKKRKALAELFGGEEKFGRLMETLADESRAAQTYGKVNTGSSTAANLADDTDLDGLVGVAVNAAGRGLAGHGMMHNAVTTLADLYRYGLGEAGKRVRSELAEAISETDPVKIRKALAAAEALEKREKITTPRAKLARSATGAMTIGSLARVRH